MYTYSDVFLSTNKAGGIKKKRPRSLRNKFNVVRAWDAPASIDTLKPASITLKMYGTTTV